MSLVRLKDLGGHLLVWTHRTDYLTSQALYKTVTMRVGGLDDVQRAGGRLAIANGRIHKDDETLGYE